jgi:hypothetical protein
VNPTTKTPPKNRESQKEIFLRCQNWHEKAAQDLRNPAIPTPDELTKVRYEALAKEHDQRALAISIFIKKRWPQKA